MSSLRITCPRCQASLSINHQQEQSGHLGCTHCGQLIRLAPRQVAPLLAAPMVTPFSQPQSTWQSPPVQRNSGGNGWIAVAIASIGLFLTVLTICITILWSQQMRSPESERVSSNEPFGRTREKVPEPEPAPAKLPVANEIVKNEPPPEMKVPDKEFSPLPPSVSSNKDDSDKDTDNLLGNNGPLPEAEKERPLRDLPSPASGGGGVTPPTPQVTMPTPPPEPERPRPAINSGLIK